MAILATILGLWEGVSRFWNKETALAIGIAVAASVLVVGAGVGLHNLKVSMTAARDSEWRASIAEANRETERAIARRDKTADDAADKERKAWIEELDAARDREAELERRLAERAGDDPIVIPRDLAREIRK